MNSTQKKVIVVGVLLAMLIAAGTWFAFAQTGTVKANQALYGVIDNVTDVDGDAPLWADYVWYKDEVEFLRQENVELTDKGEGVFWGYSTVPEGTTKKKEVWRFEARSFDGEDYSPWSSAEVTIRGWWPIIGSIKITTENPAP